MNDTVNAVEGFVTHDMEVTSLNKATRKREPVGKVKIFVPLLSTLGIKTDALIDGEKKPIVDDDGIPQYADDKHNFVQNAIFASVKAMARNRLESGSISLKDGQSIPANWDDLTAETVRNGGGAGLVIYQEVKALFQTWVKSLGKSQAAYDQITGLFANKKQLAVSPASVKEKMAGYIGDFANTLDAEQAERYQNTLVALDTLCNSETVEADDF